MRWALALLLVGGAARARVIRVPEIVSACPSAATWDDIRACVDKHGHSTLAQSLPHARLIRVAHKGEKRTDLVLFLEDKGWRLGGLSEDAGELLGFEHVTLGKHDAYRIDLGRTDRGDEATIVQRHEQLYCTGSGYRCWAVTIACDVLVGGKATETFRGTVTWKNNQLHVTGDRSRARGECEQAEDVQLYFPDSEID
jgi:hypothetical protein